MKKDHIHTYTRIKGKKDLYMCTNAECNFYSKKEMLFGKKAGCPLCGQVFILDRIQLENKVPRCANCKRVKKNDQMDLLKGMF